MTEWTIAKQEGRNWKTVVSNIPDEARANEWLAIKRRNQKGLFKKVPVKDD